MVQRQWSMMGTVILLKLPDLAVSPLAVADDPAAGSLLRATGNGNAAPTGSNNTAASDSEKPAAWSEILLDQAEAFLQEAEHRFSANDPQAELGAVNQAAGQQPVAVHPQLFELISTGVRHSLAPDSNLNIAIGPLVQTWRIGFADARVPAEKEIRHLVQLTDPRKIQLDSAAHTVFLEEAGMRIDLGALAKGYIADVLLDWLQAQGVLWALLNLGGNLVVYGPTPTQADGRWRVGIQDPGKPRNEYLEVLALAAADGPFSVVTSGIYERHLEQDGRSYHHILDPRTGYPQETDVVSLTVISRRSVDGEIWTTRLFGQPQDTVLAALEAQPELEGILVDRTGAIRHTSGIAALLA